MFSLLGLWRGNEAEPGACFSSASSSGADCRVGGFRNVFLLIPASCLLEGEKSLYCVTGKDIKVTLSSQFHARWPVQNDHSGGVSWRRLPPDLNSFLPPYQVRLAKLPPAPFHSLMYGYFWPPLYISVSGLKAWDCSTNESSSNTIWFFCLEVIKDVQNIFFLLLENSTRPRCCTTCMIDCLPSTVLQEHALLCGYILQGSLWKWQQSK